jgi:cell division septum initiation protein DivIVA
MNDNSDLLPNLTHQDAFEMQMRGYSRRQVDEFIARCRSQIRDLEQRLARALDDGEELKRDLATARQQALGAKPAHEEVSERIAQILKLADDEARSQKSKAHEDIARQRNEAQQEADKVRAEAREQAERMLTAAQEQAERAITSARAEADKTVTAARAEAENTTTDARKKSEAVLASAKAQAKKALDEATARATAIHDGAERRLNLLSTRHSETIKRLSDILDGVSSLVAAETARMSLEDEVDQATAKAIAASESAGAARPAGASPGPNGPTAATGPAGPGPSAGSRPATPSPAGGASSRPAPTAPAQPSSSASGQGTPGSTPSQDKRASARTGVLDSDDHPDGVRLAPPSDN